MRCGIASSTPVVAFRSSFKIKNGLRYGLLQILCSDAHLREHASIQDGSSNGCTAENISPKGERTRTAARFILSRAMSNRCCSLFAMPASSPIDTLSVVSCDGYLLQQQHRMLEGTV